MSGLSSSPLVIEDGVDEFVRPLSLGNPVVHEVRLPAHADPLHQARRRVITGVTGPDDPVPADGVESQREKGFGGLGSQASPVVVRIEDEPDLALLVLPADQLEPGLADHLPGRTPHDGEREPVTFGTEGGLLALLGQGLAYLRPIAGIPGQITGYIRA